MRALTDPADMAKEKKNSFQNRIPVLQHAVIHRIAEMYRYYAQLNVNIKLFINCVIIIKECKSNILFFILHLVV